MTDPFFGAPLDRLAALQRHDIGTNAEEDFDRVTRLAAQWFDVPIALVTTVGEEQQWFKSCIGLDIKSTSRAISFCAHNLHGEEVMVVEDATQDPRFAQNPLVTGAPGFRFYAGAPLVVSGGHMLGSLCVIDTAPRSVRDADLDVLQDLAAMVVREIERRAIRRQRDYILEEAPRSLLAVNPNWTLTYVNSRAADFIGAPRATLVGQNMWDVFPEAEGRAVYQRCHDAARHGAPVQLEAFLPTEDEWLRLHAHPHEEGLSVYFESITEEKAHQDELRLMSQAVESATESVLVTEGSPLAAPGPRIEYVNAAFERMTGYAADEVIGRTPRLLQGPNTDRAVLDMVRDRLEAGEDVVGMSTQNYRKDGTPYWVEWNITAVRGENGTIEHWVSVQGDITKRRERKNALRHERNILARIFDASARALVIINAEGEITRANSRAEEVLGLKSGRLKGRTYNDFLWNVEAVEGGPFPPEELPFSRVMETEAPVYGVQYAITWPSGQRRILSVNGAPLRDGTPLRDGDGSTVGAVFSITDVTDQHERARALRASKERAEQAQAEAEEARAVAEEASRLKSALLANMSHEIRTPLTSIIGFSEILEEMELPEPGGQFTELIHSSGRRLLDTLNSVLDLSQLEAGTMQVHLEPVALKPLVKEISDSFMHRAQRANVELQLAGFSGAPAVAYADSPALQRVLSNLISNAIKFTGEGNLPGGTVTIQLTPGPDTLRLSVIDTGVGIDPDFRSNLFKAFEQESTGDARQFEGNGLGLAISKQLMDLMGGTIEVESTKGEGTTFTLTLPQAD